MDIICENLDAMLTLKSQNKDVQATLNELFPQLVGENGFAFQKLFKIAFDNCESKERAMRLMNESIEALEIVTYDQINVIMWFSNDFSVCKFYEDDDEQSIIIELARKIVKERSRLVSTYGGVKTFDILPVQKYKDKFSIWEFDPLASQMRIFVELNNGELFSRNWKLSENAIINFEKVKTYEDFTPNLQENLNSNMSLLDFCEAVTHNKGILKPLQELHISTVENLMELDDNGWDRISDRLPAYVNKLKNSINIIEGLNKPKEELKRTHGELLHDWHKAKLSLYYYSNSDYKKFSFISSEALNVCFEEQKEDETFDVGKSLFEIKSSLTVYTTAQNETFMREKSHGLLLYGPPGTGKTRLSKIIIKKGGFQSIIEPLSSAELSRSLVGETEKLLMAIWERAKRCPHLLCCIAIDEIDALTPKRNDKAAGHKVDALSLLLSLVGGIKDIPNVFVIGSTNYKNKIDDAFSRRIEDKIFIGKLTNEQRIAMLKQIKCEKANLPKHVEIDFDELSDLVAKLTTNFSGAALASLRTRLLTYFDLNRERTSIKSISKDLLIDLAVKVADDFQVRLGKCSIPRMLKDSPQNFDNLWVKVRQEIAINSLSGRAVIDLQEKSRFIGFENKKKKNLLEIKLENIVHSSHSIPMILDFSIKFKIDNIQLINNDLLASTCSFDEAAINELINESLEEFDKFENGLIIFDIDNLVGVSESGSSTNDTNSNYSIQKQSVWQNILFFYKTLSNTSHTKKWCFIISSSQFLIKQLKSLTYFPKSEMELETEKKDSDDKNLKRKCKNCHNIYHEAQNSLDSCSFHDGALVRLDMKDEPITIEGLHNLLISQYSNKEEIEDLAKKYIFLCCTTPFLEGKLAGCKRNMHSDNDLFTYDPNAIQITTPPLTQETYFYDSNEIQYESYE